MDTARLNKICNRVTFYVNSERDALYIKNTSNYN